MKLKLLAAAALLIATAAPATQADDRVRLLGSTRLSQHENDRDVIAVSCRPRVGAVKLRATNGSAEIEHIWVRYGNGERDTLRVRDRLRSGSETRWIDLEGGRRCITAIGVVGDSEDRGGRRERGRDWDRGRDRPRNQTRIDIYGRFGRG